MQVKKSFYEDQFVTRDGSYTQTRKTRFEPTLFMVGMGMKDWKKMGIGRVR